MLQRVTVTPPDDFDWLLAQGIHLTREQLARLFIALGALINGTDQIEPNRSHAVSIALVMRDAIRNTGGE